MQTEDDKPESTTAADPPADDKAKPAADAAEGKDGEEKKPAKRPWFERRMGQMAEQLRQKDAELAALKTAPKPEAKSGNPDANADAEKRRQAEIQVAAEQLAAQRAYNATCNQIYDTGSERYTDFDDALKVVQTAGGGINPILIDAATATDDPAAALYLMGKDEDEAERIGNLSPARQAAALIKLVADAKKAPKKESKTPNPPSPVGNAKVSSDNLEDPQMPMADWAAKFQKRMSARAR